MKAIGIVATGIVVLAIMLSLAFGLEWAGIAWKGFFGPKHAAIEREVFKQTRSYNEGKAQELAKLHFEYMRAKPEDRPAIVAMVRHAFAEYDETLIASPSLRQWLRAVKTGTIIERIGQ